MAKESTLYVRNGRPNGVVFHFDGVRYALKHRGHREDSVALPAEAANDGQVSRWLQMGQLEKITKDDFMKLGQRTVDILPNEYLKRPLRQGRGVEVPMRKADADTTGAVSQINDSDVNIAVRNTLPEWAGDLMSTEEELDSPEFVNQQKQAPSYPSRHRDGDNRERGY